MSSTSNCKSTEIRKKVLKVTNQFLYRTERTKIKYQVVNENTIFQTKVCKFLTSTPQKPNDE